MPTTFLIKTLPAIIKSKPSRINPPTIGTEFEIAYFVALIETPSKVALVIPCIDKKTVKIVIINPIIHLIKLVATAPYFSNLIDEEKLEIILKIKVKAISGIIKYKKIFIIPFVKNETVGL